jgi:hypothetical protein
VAIGIGLCGVAHAQEPSPLPADWRTVEVRKVEPGHVAGLYTDMQARRLGYASPEVFRQMIASGELVYVPMYLNSMDGHQWQFEANTGLVPPRHAIEAFDSSTDGAYRMTVRLWCESDEICATQRARAETWRAVAPRDGVAHAQWEALIKDEFCDPGPQRLAAFGLPRSIGGTLVAKLQFKVTTNSCGDIRDIAIVQSSGNRVADRLILEGLLRSRIAARSVTGILPIDLKPGP